MPVSAKVRFYPDFVVEVFTLKESCAEPPTTYLRIRDTYVLGWRCALCLVCLNPSLTTYVHVRLSKFHCESQRRTFLLRILSSYVGHCPFSVRTLNH